MGRYSVGAHYYPWYVPNKLHACTQKPRIKLEQYLSTDRSVVEYHIALAKGWGIDTFVLECVAPADGTAIDTVFLNPTVDLRPRNLNDISYLILYDFDIRVRTSCGARSDAEETYDFSSPCQAGTTIGDRWQSDMRRIIDRYAFNHTWNYQYFRDRPAIWLYNSYLYLNAREHIRSLKRYAIDKYGVEPYLIADLGWVQWPTSKPTVDQLPQQLAPLDESMVPFDAVSGYALMTPTPDPRSQIELKRQVWGYVKEVIGDIRLPIDFFPSAGPQRQDVLPVDDRCQIKADSTPHMLESRAEFDEILGSLREYADAAPGRYFFITTFNEWFEWTTVEPTVRTPPGGSKYHRRDTSEIGPGRIGTYEFDLLDAIKEGLVGTGSGPATLDARVLDASVPSRVTASTRQSVRIRYANLGRFDWSEKAEIKLGRDERSANPLKVPNRVELSKEALVRRGEVATFSFNIQIPSQPGLYMLEVQMLMENFRRFGQVLRRPIEVLPVDTRAASASSKQRKSPPAKVQGELCEHPDCWVEVCRVDDEVEVSLVINGPAELSDLASLGEGGWADRITSLRTGSNAWLKAWGDAGFQGAEAIFDPDSDYPDVRNSVSPRGIGSLQIRCTLCGRTTRDE